MLFNVMKKKYIYNVEKWNLTVGVPEYVNIVQFSAMTLVYF